MYSLALNLYDTYVLPYLLLSIPPKIQKRRDSKLFIYKTNTTFKSNYLPLYFFFFGHGKRIFQICNSIIHIQLLLYVTTQNSNDYVCTLPQLFFLLHSPKLTLGPIEAIVLASNMYFVYIYNFSVSFRYAYTNSFLLFA